MWKRTRGVRRQRRTPRVAYPNATPSRVAVQGKERYATRKERGSHVARRTNRRGRRTPSVAYRTGRGATPHDVAVRGATPKARVAAGEAVTTWVRHAGERRTPRGVRNCKGYATRARVAVEWKSVAARPGDTLRRGNATHGEKTDVAVSAATSPWKPPRHEAWRWVHTVDRIVETCGKYAGA